MLSFISGVRCRTSQSTYPPGRASNPQAPVYLVFQPIRFTLTGITAGGVSSYLAISPLPASRRYLFCGTVCHTCVCLPVRKYGALCCPDFPQPQCGRDNSVFLLSGSVYRLIIQHYWHYEHENVLVFVAVVFRENEGSPVWS